MSELHALLLPGSPGPGPWHWQRWLATRLPESGAAVQFVPAPCAEDAAFEASDEWLAELRARLAAVPPEAELAVVAHAAGAVLWLRHAATVGSEIRRAERVLLVSPVAPGRAHLPRQGTVLTPTPPDARSLREAGGPTRLVVGTGDPALPLGSAQELARQLHVELDVIADGGGLNTATGYGPWPAARRWALYGSAPLADRFEAASRTSGWSPARPV